MLEIYSKIHVQHFSAAKTINKINKTLFVMGPMTKSSIMLYNSVKGFFK